MPFISTTILTMTAKVWPVSRIGPIVALLIALHGTCVFGQSIDEIRTLYDRAMSDAEVVDLLGGQLGVLELGGMVKNIDAIGKSNISFTFSFGGTGSKVKAKVHDLSQLTSDELTSDLKGQFENVVLPVTEAAGMGLVGRHARLRIDQQLRMMRFDVALSIANLETLHQTVRQGSASGKALVDKLGGDQGIANLASIVENLDAIGRNNILDIALTCDSRGRQAVLNVMINEQSVEQAKLTDDFKARFAGQRLLRVPAYPDAPNHLRLWTDATGKHRVEAAFLGLEDDRVLLKKADAKTIAVQLEKLSATDIRFVKAHSSN